MTNSIKLTIEEKPSRFSQIMSIATLVLMIVLICKIGRKEGELGEPSESYE